MKKIVLTFGLIGGAVMAAMMFGTLPFIDKIGFDRGLIVGYTTMILAFMLVFFGIRSYRENVGGGQITFGRAFAVGILITLVVCVCYVAAWEILYFKFMPDFADKYASYMVEKVRSSGASQQVIDAKLQEMKSFKEMYNNPFINAAMTFVEPLPVGLIITLISAAFLRKKTIAGTGDEGQPAQLQVQS
ncbi:MAG TPA: DUF4199 domain-containing protein [Blastocatellia bacterium]|nr:DUF4199 domain-containing protein [Blastocatellia bacterium]